jgi:hypothetical protein
MAAPTLRFHPGKVSVPFASLSSSLGGSLDLQVPTALGIDIRGGSLPTSI